MAVKKPLRHIQVQPTNNWGVPTGEFFYHVRSRSVEGEILYVSQSYASKSGAEKAARREHSGRSNFTYLLHTTYRGSSVAVVLK